MVNRSSSDASTEGLLRRLNGKLSLGRLGVTADSGTVLSDKQTVAVRRRLKYQEAYPNLISTMTLKIVSTLSLEVLMINARST